MRTGTYNVRVITADDTGENAWANRKARVVRSIRDNDFDFFGLNECSSDIQTYLSSELSDSYDIRFFSPYSQDGNGDKAQGLAYKKGFTLSNWHYFWLSDTPGTMTTNDGTMNRGGCCGTLTNTSTGDRIFVMVTHGALDGEVRAAYAPLYAEMEAEYNPDGYPSFFVGDMNARPAEAASVEYRKYWTDVYDGVGASGRRGPFATFNGFDLGLDLNSDPRRIDYIYYRGAVPVRYVCNDAKYDGYYASDHLPIYADFIIE